MKTDTLHLLTLPILLIALSVPEVAGAASGTQASSQPSASDQPPVTSPQSATPANQIAAGQPPATGLETDVAVLDTRVGTIEREHSLFLDRMDEHFDRIEALYERDSAQRRADFAELKEQMVQREVRLILWIVGWSTALFTLAFTLAFAILPYYLKFLRRFLTERPDGSATA